MADTPTEVEQFLEDTYGHKTGGVYRDTTAGNVLKVKV